MKARSFKVSFTILIGDEGSSLEAVDTLSTWLKEMLKDAKVFISNVEIIESGGIVSSQ